jgi:pimeloyl-ACP methyl ester carboxylesterase
MDGVLRTGARPRVLWINPSGTEFGGTSIGRFAGRLAGRADVSLLGLQVWHQAPEQPYSMSTEVDAVTAAAAGDRIHLVGFSAGATVALAAALALGAAVRSVTVLEPAFIGDDDWDPVEAKWRSRIAATAQTRGIAEFRRLLMRPGLQPTPPREEWTWGFRDDLLEGMLVGGSGFVSADLAAIRAPVLAILGGRSHPRWGAASRRLAEVCPDARECVFPQLHHFAPPFRDEPQALASILLRLWAAC